MQIIYSTIALLTGLGVFMAGVQILRKSLQTVISGKVVLFLRKIKNRYTAASMGASAAALMQSSGAVTTIAIGLVNSGTMSLFVAAAIILGANVGTTMTSLTIASSMLSFGKIFGLLVLVGSFFGLLCKKNYTQNIGQALMGLGFVFVGMQTMSNAFSNSALATNVANLFVSVKFAPLLVLIAALLTAVLQSSSAMMAITISMVATNTLPLHVALFIVLGADAGSCITAILAGLGTTKDAQRASLIQLLFNVFGVVLFTFLLAFFGNPVTRILQSITPSPAMNVGIFHVFFNLITVVIALPLLKKLTSLTKSIIK